MRILIVDDSKAMQTIVRKTLVSAGYVDHEFQYAINGVEALELIRKWLPDIVLSDWHMPEMSGLELLKSIKSEGLKVKVGLVTTERSRQRVKEARDAGALFIVSKPFNAQTLHEAVEEALAEEDSIEDQADQSRPQDDITLPSTKSIERVINSFSRHKASIVRTDDTHLDYEAVPFLTGLYEDPDSGRTVGAVIMDVAAACYIGASMRDIDVDEAVVSVDNNHIPNAIFDNAKSLINLMSTLFHDKKREVDFDVKAIHLVAEPKGKLRSLVEKARGQKHYLDIHVESYGQGKMLLLSLY